MKALLKVLIAVLVLIAAVATTYLLYARPVVTGYAAKHMCSGLWVGQLPEQWLRDKAIAPALQPASSWLGYDIDYQAHRVSVSFLGYQQVAQWRGHKLTEIQGEKHSDSINLNLGCVLLDQYGSEVVPNGKTEVRASLTADAEDAMTPVDTDSTSDAAAEQTSAISASHQDQLAQLIDEAFRESGNSPRNTLALVVSHKGNVIAERYAEPVQADTSMLGWSMSKSLLPTWIAIQEHQEQREINPKINDNWAWLSSHMTLEHLLRMESGLDFSEWYQPGDDVTSMLYLQGNMASFVASKPWGNPGTRWAYSSGDSNLASFEWKRQLPSDWRRWLVRNVWQPLGITSAVVETDQSDTPVMSSYTHMTPADWQKVGQLWLDGWHNRSPLLPADWMKQATRPSDVHQLGLYGEGFWLNRGSDSRPPKWPETPRSVFWARGHDGQYVLVAPEQELVVVRFGLTPGDNDGLDTLVAGLIDVLNQVE